MKKIGVIIFILCWNAAISQNKFVALIHKTDVDVYKFNLPEEVSLTVEGRYKMVKNKQELIHYNAILLDVRNDSLFLESIDKKSKRIIIWDSIESIKFSKQNSKGAVLAKYMMVTGAMTLVLPFLFRPVLLPAMIYPFCFLFSPIAIVIWSYSKREFAASEYLIVN